MRKKSATASVENITVREPHRARLPGFVSNEEIGLGDMIKRVTYAVGIKPCGGCHRRAAALNRWMVFGGEKKS